jgi:hypothetical protein
MSVRVRIFFVHLHEYNNEKNYEERKEKIKNEFGDSNYHFFLWKRHKKMHNHL